jgi:hypothetical protein
MAVTALKRVALLLVFAAALAAQQSKAIYHEVSQVATALTSGNPSDAMTPFDKSFAGYDQLRDYFIALSNVYQTMNEIEIMEQEIGENDATLKIQWTLTLTSLADGISQTRSEEVTVKLHQKKYQWRIVDFSPIELFNPELRQSK